VTSRVLALGAPHSVSRLRSRLDDVSAMYVSSSVNVAQGLEA
jgi:hypothetical protein